MFGLNSPNFSWYDQMWMNSVFTQQLDTDLQYRYGPTPLLIIIHGNQNTGVTTPQTFDRCRERGIRQLVCKFYVPPGPTPSRGWFVDTFGPNLDMIIGKGLYPAIESWGEETERVDLTKPLPDHLSRLADKFREVDTALSARFPLWVLPPAFAQDRVRTPLCVAAFDSIYKTKKAFCWHYYAVTRADQEPTALFTPEWIAQQYPDAQIVVTEWGMLWDKTNADSPQWTEADRCAWIRNFGARLINNPQVQSAYYFLPDGTADWAQHFINTDALKEAFRNGCDLARAQRIWLRTAPAVVQPPIPGEVDVAALIAQMNVQWKVYEQLLANRDVRFGQDDALAIRMFNSVVKVKEVLGLQ